MNKVLLVQQFLGDNHEVGPVFPIGLSYLATYINQTDWSVRVFDMNIYDDPYRELLDTLASFRPDVIGLSLRNIDNVDFENFQYFYKEIDGLIPILKQHSDYLIIGGAGFSIFASEIMQQHKEIDFGIFQEGEDTIVELLQALNNRTPISNILGLYYWEDGVLCFSGERNPIDFSKSPIPDRSFFDIQKYNKPLCMGIQTKRGCSLKCSYCIYPFLNKHTERFRSPQSVVDEIETLVNKYQIDEIIFCDDIFNVPINHSKQIIEGIILRGIKIKWSAWFDVGSTDEELIRKAIKSGCYRFCFSLEGVVDSSLKLLHKNFDSKQANQLINICMSKQFKDIDFRFSLFAMPPGQTYWGMIKTICIVFKTHIMKLNSKCLISWIRLLPNTELYSAIDKPESNLLPPIVVGDDKDKLFYHNTSINPFAIKLYRYLINRIIALRSIRKRLRLKNQELWI